MYTPEKFKEFINSSISQNESLDLHEIQHVYFLHNYSIFNKIWKKKICSFEQVGLVPDSGIAIELDETVKNLCL